MSRRTITKNEFNYLKSTELGERLRFFRKEVGKLHTSKAFTTTAMSERLGVSHQTIISIERGDSKKPSYQLIYKITQDLGIPFEVLTDEFYQGELLSIAIGEAIQFHTPNHGNSSSSYIGVITYQLFADGMMRLIHDLRSSQPLNDEGFISALGRVIGEFQSHSKTEELFQQPHPMVKASQLYEGMDKHPDAFPLFPNSEWNVLLNEFTKTIKPKESISYD